MKTRTATSFAGFFFLCLAHIFVIILLRLDVAR
jgi:hypothetical protein